MPTPASEKLKEPTMPTPSKKQAASPLERLQALLRDLFQLDTADLDFGLYRLFHLKRAEIEVFLTQQLQAEVEKAFASAAGAEREALEKRLQELAQRARETVADDAILPSGEPNPEHAGAKAVKEYIEAKAKLRAIEASAAQQAEAFNLLYGFFSRYYDDGDFISRRFFGAQPAYVVPYNGEEVLFHWANKDQYYVKSGEAFRDYAFTVPTVGGDYRVRFQLVEATTAKDNTKGDVRFFFPLTKEIAFEKASQTLTVPFHYRLPTEEEVAKHGKNAKGQEAVLEAAAPKIIEAVSDTMLKAALAAAAHSENGADGEDSPGLLRRRLGHFTIKNTSDYFVHKNLGAFLRQELGFFLRDQVVHEADLEGDFESKRRTMRVFRKLADTLITFLAQVEDAQKRLFEKKKFVLRTDYLVPVQQVPRSLWPEVLANKAQLDEWKALYALEPKSDLFNLKGKINEHVLEQHPTLVVDTRFFPVDFVARLLQNIEDIDDQIDGNLIHGENFQALRLTSSRLRSELTSIYIDPPYNSDAGPISYKNGYRHSSWIALLSNGLSFARKLLDESGILCVTIDDYEAHRLRALCEEGLGGVQPLGVVVIKNNPAGRTGTRGFSICHEYAFFYGMSDRVQINRLEHTQDQKARYDERDEIGSFEWTNFRKHGGLNTFKLARPRQFYPIYVKGSQIRIPKMTWDDGSRKYIVDEKPAAGEEVLLPTDEQGRERIWDFGVDTARKHLVHLKVRKDSQDRTAIYRKWRLHEDGILPKTVWDKSEYSAAEYGTNLLKDMFGTPHLFMFPKSVHAVADCLKVSGLKNESEGAVLDFFAGSGTTGHAIMNLNREDGGHRKFTLVEVGAYFDSVLVKRLKKAMFVPEWKDGKPRRLPTMEEAERTPRLVRVLRLESYEDALHNTFSDKAVGHLAPREGAYKEAVGEGEYRIRYMVKLPTEASDSMLNLTKLEHPFDYTLEVLSDYGPKTTAVDIVETFNWLYGLRVHRLLAWMNKDDKRGKDKAGRFYRAVVASDREGRKRILVVWRDMTSLDPALERGFLEAKVKELGTFEEQWINSDSAVPGFASLDALFKRLMEEPVR